MSGALECRCCGSRHFRVVYTGRASRGRIVRPWGCVHRSLPLRQGYGAQGRRRRARAAAAGRMVDQAAEMGADAIINLYYMTTSVVGSAAELLAYGTAVKLSE